MSECRLVSVVIANKVKQSIDLKIASFLPMTDFYMLLIMNRMKMLLTYLMYQFSILSSSHCAPIFFGVETRNDELS